MNAWVRLSPTICVTKYNAADYCCLMLVLAKITRGHQMNHGSDITNNNSCQNQKRNLESNKHGKTPVWGTQNYILNDIWTWFKTETSLLVNIFLIFDGWYHSIPVTWERGELKQVWIEVRCRQFICVFNVTCYQNAEKYLLNNCRSLAELYCIFDTNNLLRGYRLI